MIIADSKIFEQMENELAKAKAATTKASQDKHLHGLMLLVQLAKQAMRQLRL